MIKLTKQQRRENMQKAAKTAGIEKFRNYAIPRGIKLKEMTYGVHKVVHNGRSSQREAVMAFDKDGNRGWVINLSNRQRKFVADTSGYIVIL